MTESSQKLLKKYLLLARLSFRNGFLEMHAEKCVSRYLVFIYYLLHDLDYEICTYKKECKVNV